ncbi:2-aminoethanethiol dioxygenase [Lutzomyia longipalpis]|uniref:2-aminoethanethiol dioxygenase n=1 Tax=Lutzomyia longipalpis TaxID=7200 RepID=A0A1B0CQG2_LUTLO|nr:2-aminoethanethiol dioxygenase [Lutzomyia longipalpis]
MSVHFAKIAQQARQTFDPHNILQFATNFLSLQKLVDEMKFEDIQVNPEVLSRRSFDVPDKAPCTYIHIYECPIFSMNVFILAENYTMPLHDHPAMHGLLKCIGGRIKVQSFTSIASETAPSSKDMFPVHVNAPMDFNASSPAAVLTPNEGNFHEITAIAGGGPGAFFDILGPPYDSPLPPFGKRKCSYFRKINDLSGNWFLQKTPTPSHYFCDVIRITPDFLKDDD